MSIEAGKCAILVEKWLATWVVDNGVRGGRGVA